MLKMKKGFVFAIMFLLFFTLLLSFAIFYKQIKQPAKIQTFGFVTDDIKDDLLKLYGTEVTLSKNTNFTEVTFIDTMPNPLPSAAQELDHYKQFLKTYYSVKTNSNITLNSVSNTIHVKPFGLDYRHDSINKTRLSLASKEKITAYVIKVRLSRTCDFICQFNTQTNWQWANNGTFVYLDIRDPENNLLSINGNNSGFINSSSSIDLNFDSGSYHLDVFDSLNQIAYNTNVQSNISVYYLSNSPTSVSLPVDLELNNIKIDELVLSKN